MSRQQLPPQIKKVEVLDRSSGKTVVRYRVKVDVGPSPQTGKRQQAKRHCRTEQEARKVLAELQNKAVTGTYVSPSKMTVEQVSELRCRRASVRNRTVLRQRLVHEGPRQFPRLVALGHT